MGNTQQQKAPWEAHGIEPRVVARAIIEEAKRIGLLLPNNRSGEALLGKVISLALDSARRTIEIEFEAYGFGRCGYCLAWEHEDNQIERHGRRFCGDGCWKRYLEEEQERAADVGNGGGR